MELEGDASTYRFGPRTEFLDQPSPTAAEPSGVAPPGRTGLRRRLGQRVPDGKRATRVSRGLSTTPADRSGRVQVNSQTQPAEDPDVSLARTEASSSHSGDQDGSFDASDAFLQQFDSAGNKLGMELRVNTFTLDDQDMVTHCAAADGAHFVVAWESGPYYSAFGNPDPMLTAQNGIASEPGEQDGSRAGVFGQVFGNTATQTPTFTIRRLDSDPDVYGSATPRRSHPPANGTARTLPRTRRSDSGHRVGNIGSINGPVNRGRRIRGDLHPPFESETTACRHGRPTRFLRTGGTDANGNFSIMLNRRSSTAT